MRSLSILLKAGSDEATCGSWKPSKLHPLQWSLLCLIACFIWRCRRGPSALSATCLLAVFHTKDGNPRCPLYLQNCGSRDHKSTFPSRGRTGCPWTWWSHHPWRFTRIVQMCNLTAQFAVCMVVMGQQLFLMICVLFSTGDFLCCCNQSYTWRFQGVLSAILQGSWQNGSPQVHSLQSPSAGVLQLTCAMCFLWRCAVFSVQAV